MGLIIEGPICREHMHVQYVGPFAQQTFDSELACETMLAIHREGISLEIVPIAFCDSEALDERYRELLPLVHYGSDCMSKRVTHRIVHADPWTAERIIQEEQAVRAQEEAWPEGLCNQEDRYVFQMIIVSQDAQTFRLEDLWQQQRSFHPLSPFQCIALTSNHSFWSNWKMTGNLRQLQRNLKKIVELRTSSRLTPGLNKMQMAASDVLRILKERA